MLATDENFRAFRTIRATFLSALLAAAIGASGCGSESTSSVDGSTPVVGAAIFGTQCPYGTISPPISRRLELNECPISFSPLELAEPLQPLLVQVDCAKKILTVRSPDRRVDHTWSAMPDGSFTLTADGGLATLKRDASGKACQTPVTAELWGRFQCLDKEKANIQFKANYTLGKTPPRSDTGQVIQPTAPLCQLPAGCFLYSAATIKQCM